MAVAGRLTTQITADASGFVQGLSSAKSELKRFADDAKKAQSEASASRLGGLREVFGGAVPGNIMGLAGKLGGPAAGAAVFTGGLRWMQGMAAESVELQKAAKRFGVTTEELEKLDKVGKRIGVDGTVMTGALNKLRSEIGKAKLGGGEAGLFEALGLDVQSLGGMSRLDAMKEVGRALGNIQDESIRAAVAMQLFGKAGADVDAVLKELATGKTPNVISSEARAGYAHFAEGQKALGGIGTTIKNDIGLVLNEVYERMINAGAAMAGDPMLAARALAPEVGNKWAEEIGPLVDDTTSIATAATATFGSKESVEAVLGAGVARTNDLLAAIVANTTPQEAE